MSACRASWRARLLISVCTAKGRILPRTVVMDGDWRCSGNAAEERVSAAGTARGRGGQFRRLPGQRRDGRDRLRVARVTVAAARARRPDDPTSPVRLQRFVS